MVADTEEEIRDITVVNNRWPVGGVTGPFLTLNAKPQSKPNRDEFQ